MTKLTPKQRQAALLVATGRTYKEVAKCVRVTPQTMSEWSGKDEFRIAVEGHLSRVEHATTSALAGLRSSAVQRLGELVQSISEATSLKAVQLVLELTTTDARTCAMPTADDNTWQAIVLRVKGYEKENRTAK